jgi:hypothetical protein
MHEAFPLLILPVIGVILFVWWFFSRKTVVLRTLRRKRSKRISEFEENDVAKTTGKIKYLGETLIAPLSGRKCVYYYVLVQGQRPGSRRDVWNTLIEEEMAGDVVIHDGNSYAVIASTMVKSYLVPDKNYSSGFLKNPTDRIERYLKKHGHETTGALGFNLEIQYKEGILEEGELIVVLGKGTWKPARELNFKFPVEKVLMLNEDGETPVYLSDAPEAVERPE